MLGPLDMTNGIGRLIYKVLVTTTLDEQNQKISSI